MNNLKAKGFHVNSDGKAKRIITMDETNKETPVSRANAMLLMGQQPKTGIFIPMNVPSSKNSRQLAVIDGKPKSFESKLCAKYRQETKPWYIERCNDFKRMVEQKGLPKPLRIKFYFVRSTKIRFDHHNAVQLVMDLMVEHGWVPDDNANEIVAVPPEGQVYHVDKSNAGVYIIV